MSIQSRRIIPNTISKLDKGYFVHKFGIDRKEIITIDFENSPSIQNIFRRTVERIKQKNENPIYAVYESIKDIFTVSSSSVGTRSLEEYIKKGKGAVCTTPS